MDNLFGNTAIDQRYKEKHISMAESIPSLSTISEKLWINFFTKKSVKIKI